MSALKRIKVGGSAWLAPRASALYRSAAAGSPRILLVHPANLQARCWARVACELPHRWGLAAIDLTGHGDSPRSHDYTVGQWARECITLLDELEWRDVHLVGASVGAAIAIEVAAAQPERVHSLTALGGAMRAVPARETDEVADLMRAEGASTVLAKAIADDAGMSDVLAAEALADTSVNTDDTVALIWRAAAAAAGLASADRVGCRTLAIAGDQDSSCPSEDSAAFADVTGGRLAVLAGHGHLPMYTAADQVARLISTQVETRAVPARDLAVAPLKGTP